MSKLIVLLFLAVRVPACSTWELDKPFEDGKDLTITKEYKEYRRDLEVFLVSPDSMQSSKKIILPPNSEESNYIEYKKISQFQTELKIRTKSHSVYFISSNDPESTIIYKFRAFDSRNNTVYLSEHQEHFSLRLFGISMETGNQFDVYRNTCAGMNDEMYSWKFSPEFDFLLKVGDLNHDTYGWSIVNLKTGVEGLDTYVKFHEFIFGVKWIDKETFTYTYLQIPFQEGQVYDLDYQLFYALMNREPFPGIVLASDRLFPEVFTVDTKGRILSTRLHELKYR